MGFIETDWQQNIQRVSPYFGILLVIAFAALMIMVMKGAMQDITQAVHTEAPEGVAGSIRIVAPQPVTYGDDISFLSSVEGVAPDAVTYITTACFQGETLVYQRSTQQGAQLYLIDQVEKDLVWDAGAASCSATLMYRTVGGAQVDVYILDALSFEVRARSSR